MPSQPIHGSPDLTVLDSRLHADLCVGKIFVDASPSSFIGTGAVDIEGIRIKVLNPYNIAIKDYDDDYDLLTPITDDSVFSMSIPTQSGGYQLGQYIIYLQLTDSDGHVYEVVKPLNICQPNPKDKYRKYGYIYADMRAICNEGKLKVAIASPPAYNGLASSSQVNSFKIIYPPETLVSKTFSATHFSSKLYSGVHKLKGTVCATYSEGDNVFYSVRYDLDEEKDVKCIIDECCVFQKLSELHQKLVDDCSEEERRETTLLVIDVLRLLETAKMAMDCGQDASEYIDDLESLLKCSCTVQSTSAISGHVPETDVLIQGCGWHKESVGLTTIYTADILSYKIKINENGGIITAAAVAEDGAIICGRVMPINFSVDKMYAAVKLNANLNLSEALQWASIINKVLAGLNVSALGVTVDQWNAMNFSTKIQTIINSLNKCCSCDVGIGDRTITQQLNNVKLVWAEINNPEFVQVYLDGVLYATIHGGVKEVIFAGAADGSKHKYTLVPYCANNSSGASQSDEFQFMGCPYIAPLNVSTTNANQVACPFNLSALITSIPAGIEAEWHKEENTNANTLVADPMSVGSGVYYLYAKSSGTGCYSSVIRVTVTCSSGDCTAPQNLGIEKVVGGFLVYFNSAAYPPAGSAYTVKRRLRAAPDVSGSYTTIGSVGSGIVFNAGMNRWEILDTTGVNNTLYTYVAISNCGATQPRVVKNFSYFTGCLSPIGIVGSIAGNTITLTFAETDPLPQGYRIKYRKVGSVLWQYVTPNPGTGTPITFTVPELDQDWEGTLEAICDDNIFGPAMNWTANSSVHCVGMEVQAGIEGAIINWIACDGTPQSHNFAPNETYVICSDGSPHDVTSGSAIIISGPFEC